MRYLDKVEATINFDRTGIGEAAVFTALHNYVPKTPVARARQAHPGEDRSANIAVNERLADSSLTRHSLRKLTAK